jgi:pimeloyl-ACP methyl ester carboxylesterase
VDAIALMDALSIDRAVVAGCDWGARTACIMAALWPQRCKALVSVSGYLIGSQELNKMPLAPKNELEWWYQYYFATERGRTGYEKYTRDFASSSGRPLHHAGISTTHLRSFAEALRQSRSCRHLDPQLSLAPDARRGRGEVRPARAATCAVSQHLVPSITLEGDANGAPHLEPSAYAKRFTGRYVHHTLTGGVGHNLPQEAPEAFAKAVVEADGLSR